MGDPSKKGRTKVRVHDKRRTTPAQPEPTEDGASEQADAPGEPDHVEAPESGAPTAENLGAAKPDAPDYLEDLRRLQAEFENYRKRMMRDQTRMTQRASARLIERLLPVLDNFDRAVDHGDVSSGVELVYKELRRVLADEGLEEIPAEGVAFDPTVHEAVESREEADASETRCTTVYRRGYRVGDQILRPAMVGVVRPSDRSAAHAESAAEDDGRRVEADGG